MASKIKLILLFLSLTVGISSANKYAENRCTKDENGKEFCEKAEEEEEEEACFYEDPKESLFQWDPVEVSKMYNVKCRDLITV